MTDPLAPPRQRTQSEIQKAARQLERLKLRRRAAVKKLADLDDQIRTAARFLRDVIKQMTPEAEGPDGGEGQP